MTAKSRHTCSWALGSIFALVLGVGVTLVSVSGAEPAGTASIGGSVFIDADGDGVQSGILEEGLDGVSVSLSGPVNVTTVTDAIGVYAFANLPAGTYTLVEAGHAPLLDTTPNAITVAVADGEASTANFGDANPSSALVAAFRDDNADGRRQPSEPVMEGVQVKLYRDADAGGTLTPGDVELASAYTDAYGLASFQNLLPGAYILVNYNPMGQGGTTPSTAAFTAVGSAMGYHGTFWFGRASCDGCKLRTTRPSTPATVLTRPNLWRLTVPASQAFRFPLGEAGRGCRAGSH